MESLEKSLTAFAEGPGSPIMTISCANSETYEQARLDPKKYDLLHARMRSWKEFSVTIFHAHRGQHQSCPFERPDADVPARSAHA